MNPSGTKASLIIPEPSVSAHSALEPRELEVLLQIAAASAPVGARELGRRLRGPDRLSESTLNRVLRRLDAQGLTMSIDGKGRIASEAGQLLAEQAVVEQKWAQQLGSLEIRTLADVRDLVAARRGVEREIARAVARSATPEDIEQLRAQLDEYERRINVDSTRRNVTVDFHKALAGLCKNKMLRASAMVLFDTRFDIFEQVLDIITASRGRTHSGPHEHKAIIDAIAAGDPDAAEEFMVQHLDRLSEDAWGEVSPSTLLAIELFLKNQPPKSLDLTDFETEKDISDDRP